MGYWTYRDAKGAECNVSDGMELFGLLWDEGEFLMDGDGNPNGESPFVSFLDGRGETFLTLFLRLYWKRYTVTTMGRIVDDYYVDFEKWAIENGLIPQEGEDYAIPGNGVVAVWCEGEVPE